MKMKLMEILVQLLCEEHYLNEEETIKIYKKLQQGGNKDDRCIH